MFTVFTFNPRFPGQYADSETGFSDNWNRTYNPNFGGYIQSDPIGLAGTMLGSMSTYPYAAGNPVTGVDPLGLYTAIQVMGPNDTVYIPMTYVKSQTQANAFRGITGTTVSPGQLVAIPVPPGVDPQTMANQWSDGSIFNGDAEFAWYWRRGGPHDY